jgi:hypothetical protein
LTWLVAFQLTWDLCKRHIILFTIVHIVMLFY